MRPRNLVRAFLIGGFLIGTIYALHQPFREYPGVEYEGFPLPRDYQETTEWAFARLMYPPVNPYYGGFQFLGDWRLGRLELDDGLSALRPAFSAGDPPADPPARARRSSSR